MENISVSAASLILISYFIKTTLNQNNNLIIIYDTKMLYRKTNPSKINSEENE